MSEKKPTEQARFHFESAKTHGMMAHQLSAKEQGNEAMYKSHTVISLQEIASGLDSLATALRATYILLEEVKRLLEQQQRR